MLAPIALYPDQLVSQILMASTFPLQIVEAARWLDNPSNAALKGDALVTGLQPMNWDPNIKSITAFPAIVTMLNQNLDWTNSLGVAFTHQQSDVMVQIQFLRHQAQTAGNLASNDKIVCREDGPNIVIASANPNIVYVPYYNTAVVYGTWPWARVSPGLLLARLFRTRPARGRGRLGLGSSVADRAGLLGLVWGELGNGAAASSSMAAATAALPTATLLGAAATGSILAAASVMAASGAVMGAGSSQPGARPRERRSTRLHPRERRSSRRRWWPPGCRPRQWRPRRRRSGRWWWSSERRAHASAGPQGGGGHQGSGGGHPGGGGHHG